MEGVFHDIEVEVLKGLAILVGSGVLWLIKQATSWANIKLSDARQAAVEKAVDKSMTFAVTELDAFITEHHWDSIETRSVVINKAMEVVADKFAHTLSRGKVDLDDPAKRIALMEQMQRMWPDLSSRLSASPVTPEAPKVAAVVVPAIPQAQ